MARRLRALFPKHTFVKCRYTSGKAPWEDEIKNKNYHAEAENALHFTPEQKMLIII